MLRFVQPALRTPSRATVSRGAGAAARGAGHPAAAARARNCHSAASLHIFEALGQSWSCRVTVMPSHRHAESRSCRITVTLSHVHAESRSCRVTVMPSHRHAKSRSCRVTVMPSHGHAAARRPRAAAATGPEVQVRSKTNSREKLAPPQNTPTSIRRRLAAGGPEGGGTPMPLH